MVSEARDIKPRPCISRRSTSSYLTDESSDNSFNDSYRSESTNTRTSPPPDFDKIKKRRHLSRYSFYIVAIIAIVVGTLVFFNPSVFSGTAEKLCSFEDLQQRQPKQAENMWKSLQVGIENILNHKTPHPGVYLFLNPGNQSLRTLVEEIADHSASCFGRTINVLEMKDFESDDYGTIIEMFKSRIGKGNVFLFVDLNKIPPATAPALHTICDTYNPIAKDIVIFLSLTVESTVKGSPKQIAEDTLNEQWESIESNELEPLITRLTDEVFYLNNNPIT